jgi:hypothetical protein
MSMAPSASPVAPPPPSARIPRYRPWLLVLLVLAVLAVVAVVFVPSSDVEGRAVLRMPPSERSALFDATRREADLLCRQAETTDAFRKRCISTSAFLLAFPDCDTACRDFAHRFVHEQTR